MLLDKVKKRKKRKRFWLNVKPNGMADTGTEDMAMEAMVMVVMVMVGLTMVLAMAVLTTHGDEFSN